MQNPLKKLHELLQEKESLEKEKEKIISDLFKYETLYLDTTHGLPLIKTSEFYVNTRVEKKKIVISEKDRIFSVGYPRNTQ